MRSSTVLLVLSGVGALAHPSLKHLRLHQKRDSFVTTTIGNEVIIEEIKVVNLPPGDQIPATEPTSPHAIPKVLAVESPSASSSSAAPAAQWSGYHHHHQPSQSSVASQAPVETSVAPTFETPTASPVQTSEATAPPQSSSAIDPSSSPEASETSTPAPSGTFWAESPKSPLSGGSGSKDVLTQANYWRQKWLNLPPFTWSSTLANNSYMTTTQPTTYTTDSNGKQVPHDEGGAMVMGHHLYDGSNAQCIITGDDTTMNGDLTPFEVAFLGWLCEEPNDNIPCAQIGSGQPTSDTGHAEIIKSSVTQIGCYYMNSVGNSGYTGMWTCDFTGSS